MTIFGLLSGVAGFVKVRYLIDKAIIDNMIFRCHYRITSAILFVCCIIVTANNLIGEFMFGVVAHTKFAALQKIQHKKKKRAITMLILVFQAIQYRVLMTERCRGMW